MYDREPYLRIIDGAAQVSIGAAKLEKSKDPIYQDVVENLLTTVKSLGDAQASILASLSRLSIKNTEPDQTPID